MSKDLQNKKEINETDELIKQEVVVRKESTLEGAQAKVDMEINVDGELIGGITITTNSVMGVDSLHQILKQADIVGDGLNDLAVSYLLSGEFDDELENKDLTKDDLQELREMMDYNEQA